MTDEIKTILDSYNANTLTGMAQAAGFDVFRNGKKLKKKDLIAKMQAEFFSRERVLASLERLDRREREILNRLLLHEGKISTQRFRREIVRVKLSTKAPELEKTHRYYYPRAPYAHGRYSGHQENTRSTVFEDIIARLTHHGLVFSQSPELSTGNTPYKLQCHPADTLFIPQIIQRYLPEPEPIPVETDGLQPTRVRSGEPALLLRDLYLYWDFVRRHQVTLIQTGFVGKRWLKAINQVLLEPDSLMEDAGREDETGRLYLLRQLLEWLDLVRAEGGQLHLSDEDAARIPEFWSLTPTEQLGACLKLWPQLHVSNTLDDGAVEHNSRYFHARQVLMEVLQTLPPKIWLEMEDFLDRIRERDKNFLLSGRSNAANSYAGRPYGYIDDHYYYGQEYLEALEKSETEFVNKSLTGFLCQVGIVELGYGSVEATSWGSDQSESEDTLQAFRLTPAGYAMLTDEAAEPPDEDGTGNLVIQPNFQLLAMGPVSLDWLARLDLFSDRERADRGAFEYRLSRNSIYRAQKMGMSGDEVTLFLTEIGGVDLPQNVRRSLEEWSTGHERIVIRTGVSLLQAADAALLAELMDDRPTGRLLARSLSLEVALIKKNRRDEMISALLDQGLLPAVSGAQPEAADNSVIVQDDGTIRLIHAVPSLHLRGRLSRLAEETNGEGWDLTPQSIQRAGGSKNKVLRLLDELSKLHRGSLPDEVVEQVKAWGGYYGGATAETLTLVEFRDQAILDELAQHPDLQGYLGQFSVGDRALTVVPDDKLEQLKEILTRFGVRVKSGLRR